MNRQAREVEVIATSPVSWEEAARRAVARADETLAGLLGVHVVAKDAQVTDGKVTGYAIRMRLLFELAPDLGEHL